MVLSPGLRRLSLPPFLPTCTLSSLQEMKARDEGDEDQLIQEVRAAASSSALRALAMRCQELTSRAVRQVIKEADEQYQQAQVRTSLFLSLFWN